MVAKPVKTDIGPEHFQLVENNLPGSKGTWFLKPREWDNPLPDKIFVEGKDDTPTPLHKQVQLSIRSMMNNPEG